MTEGAGGRTRDDIIAIVRERGGLHKSDLQRVAARGWGTIGHHLRILEDAGCIETETHGRLLWIFDPALERQERDYTIATRPALARKILKAVGLRDRVTIRSLSEELALSRKVIRLHLSTLERAQAVRKVNGHPPTFAPNLWNRWVDPAPPSCRGGRGIRGQDSRN